jgi:hypothetical protein
MFPQAKTHTHGERTHFSRRAISQDHLVGTDPADEQVGRGGAALVLTHRTVSHSLGVLNHVEGAPLRLDEVRVHSEQRRHREFPEILEQDGSGFSTHFDDRLKQQKGFRVGIGLGEIPAVFSTVFQARLPSRLSTNSRNCHRILPCMLSTLQP